MRWRKAKPQYICCWSREWALGEALEKAAVPYRCGGKVKCMDCCTVKKVIQRSLPGNYEVKIWAAKSPNLTSTNSPSRTEASWILGCRLNAFFIPPDKMFLRVLVELSHIFLPFLKQEVTKLLQKALIRASLLTTSNFLQFYILYDSMKAYTINSMIMYSSTEPIGFATLVSKMAALVMLLHSCELVCATPWSESLFLLGTDHTGEWTRKPLLKTSPDW